MYRLSRNITMWLLALFVCAGLSSDTHAQSGTFAAQVSLREENTLYNLAPYVYVTRDSGKTMTYTGIIERHLSGKRGEVLKGDILTLGSAGVPHWVVTTINNQSQNENWVLRLGEHLDGRIGLIDKIFIYDHTARKRVIDTVSVSQVPGANPEKFSATAIPVHIDAGSSATLVMYIIPRAGVPLTLGFDLMSEASYMHITTSPLKGSNIAFLLFALVIGFHLGVMILTRSWNNTALIVYFVAQFLLFSWDNNITHSDSAYAGFMSQLLAVAALAAGYMATRSFFTITRFDGSLFRLIVAVPVAIALIVLGSSLLLSPDSMIRHLTLAAAMLGGYLFLVMVSLAQFFQGKSGSVYMALGWACVFTGAFITVIASLNILSPGVMTVAAYWYSLLPQAALVSFATIMYFVRQEMLHVQEEEEFEEESDQVTKIVQTREGQEFSRLKRLVEHERQVMQELRDREIEQNEEMRLARIGADEANRAKSAFLAVVSHEIRTPMTGIMGMVRLLLDTSLSTSQKDYAQTIQDSGDAMMSLLNDILDFEKIESGKLDLERIDFDLHRLANSIITLMSGHAKNKNIFLKLNMHPSIPRYVIGDPVRLRQVLLNLVGNSIKFTKEGGVTLEFLPDPNFEGLSRGNVFKIRFAVKDTGVGISKEAQHNLFRPFSQADSTVNRKFGGTGLGLAISQRLIEAMGNRIAIESEEGRGSTFHFTLIMEEGQGAASEAAEGARESMPGKSAKSLRILVVEDNEINQKLLKEFISRMGHEVLQAVTGEAGIEAIKTERPDMVFMDVALPGISGMGATKAIRAMSDQVLARTPVIALTGNTREEDIRTCYAANMNGHLAKPVDPIRLRQMIEKVINNKLDNPVEVAEGTDENYIPTTQLQVENVRPVENPAPKPIPKAEEAKTPEKSKEKPAPAASGKSESIINMPGQSPIMRHLRDSDSEPFSKEQEPRKYSSMPERSLVSQLVASGDIDMNFDDHELDEDTFQQAVVISEKQAAVAVTSTTAQPTSFNKSVLDPLKASMKADQLKDMISSLLEKAEEIITVLNVAAHSTDTTVIAARAHELKGMAGNFGLTELSKIAESLEKTSKTGTTAEAADLIATLSPAYIRARADVMQWMQS